MKAHPVDPRRRRVGQMMASPRQAPAGGGSIAIVDYGRGNLGSVEKAFVRLGMDAKVTQDPAVVRVARAVVLPGDGAFHDAMLNLERLGLLDPIRECLEAERPFLGICLGYQLLFSESEEWGHSKGLNLIPGVVRRFPKDVRLKVPHMGWNQVMHSGDLAIFDGIPSGAYFYFVHSYYPEPLDGTLRVATCHYGVTFPAAIGKGNLYATQFHPEKSQRWGLKLLENFTRVVKEGRGPGGRAGDQRRGPGGRAGDQRRGPGGRAGAEGRRP